MKAMLLTIPPEHLITALIVLFLCLLLPFVLFWPDVSAWFKKKPKEEPRKYLLQRQVDYRGQTIHLRVMEYSPSEPTIFDDCLSFRVSWSAAANGCYTIVRAENIGQTIKNFVEEAKAHIDRVLATPDHLAQVKDMLDKLEL